MILLTAVIGVFVWLLGLCIGSFLNVVIYRLPLGLSLSKPRWSFCPHCQATIHWYDNIPVLSWLLLRARCRNCKAPISAQYPLVEAATGLVFALVYAILIAENRRAGLGTISLATDMPLLLAWLVLAAALVACAGMDIFAYVIDVRVTNVALLGAVGIYLFWDRLAFTGATAQSPVTAGLLTTFLVGVVMMWLAERNQPAEEHAAPEDVESTVCNPGRTGSAPGAATFASAALLVALLGLALVVFTSPAAGNVRTYLIPAGFAGLLAMLSFAGGEPRAADEELHEAIEAEAPQARRVALREILWLSPAVMAGLIMYWVFRAWPAGLGLWQHFATGHASVGGLTLSPAGVLFAIYGAMVGIIVGWITRILFTLVFGREAFGVGDIYILAAAGAAAGWDIVLLAFPLSVAVALVIFLVSLLRKRTPMVAFGPPLGLGFLLALWLSRPAAVIAQQRLADVHLAWNTRPDIVLMGIGLLLVGAAVAVILARLMRQLIER